MISIEQLVREELQLFDGQVIFLVPTNKRQAYFEFIDNAPRMKAFSVGNIDSAWNPHNDPFIIADQSYFNEKQWKYLYEGMIKIGCVDITEKFL